MREGGFVHVIEDYDERTDLTDTVVVSHGKDTVDVAYGDVNGPGVWFEAQSDDGRRRKLRRRAYVDLTGNGQYDCVLDFSDGVIRRERTGEVLLRGKK